MSRKLSRLLPSISIAAVIACGAAPAFADTILIQSGDPGSGQSQTCANIFNSSTSCTAITPDPVWQSNNPSINSGVSGFPNIPSSGAVWTSFAPTGYTPDNTFVPMNTSTPSMVYTYTFLAPPDAQFIGRVWSDDTAGIYLDGLFVGGSTTGTSSGNTVGGGSTYGGSGGYSINAALGGGGGGGGGGDTSHTLTIDVYQTGTGTDNQTNPFGVLAAGAVEPTTVPEPATLALFGFGLLGAGVIRRARRKV